MPGNLLRNNEMSSIDDVIEEVTDSGADEAFYVCDLGGIVRKDALWKKCLPRVKTYYAVKCNNNAKVLETIADLGIKFDCASKGEIEMVLALNAGPDDIIFSNTVKPRSHVRYARDVGVTTTTFDNECELYKIKSLMPEAKLLIRIRCDDPTARYKLGEKFGCDFEKEAPHLLALARTLELDVVGVHFHIGSSIGDPNYYGLGISMARDLFDLAATVGFDFRILDVGGGFTGTDDLQFLKVAEIINAALDEHFPDDDAVEIIAEPGRFFVTSCFSLLCNVTSVRQTETYDGDARPTKTHNMYYLDDGLYGSFLVAVFGEPFFPIVYKKVTNTELVSSSVWGPTCDSCDCIVKECLLPKLEAGDWLRFDDMGAYSLVLACNFNHFQTTNIHFISAQGKWQARTK